MILENNKNVTFTVPTPIIKEIQNLVKAGWKPSINSLVREALERYLKEVKQEKIRQDMLEASKDPLFLADVNDCAKSFRFVDKEGVPEWK